MGQHNAIRAAARLEALKEAVRLCEQVSRDAMPKRGQIGTSDEWPATFESLGAVRCARALSELIERESLPGRVGAVEAGSPEADQPDAAAPPPR
jgi:hypothetical protein